MCLCVSVRDNNHVHVLVITYRVYIRSIVYVNCEPNFMANVRMQLLGVKTRVPHLVMGTSHDLFP